MASKRYENDLIGSYDPGALVDQDEQRVGQVLGQRYRLNSVVEKAEGSTLFVATDSTTNETCGVRVYLAALSRQQSAAFLKSAEAASAFRHERVVSVRGFGKSESGAHYVIIDRPQSFTLAQHLQKTGAQSVGRTSALLLPLAEMLNRLHQSGQVHNGIELSSVSLSKDASTARLREMRLVLDRSLVGKSRYASPEFSTTGVATISSDVWAMGMLVFECLAGVPWPAEATSTESSALRSLAPHLSEPIAQFISRCLDSNPKKRFESMHAFASAFEVLASDEADEESQTVPVTFVERSADGTVKPKTGIAAPVIAGLSAKEKAPSSPKAIKKPSPPPKASPSKSVSSKKSVPPRPSLSKSVPPPRPPLSKSPQKAVSKKSAGTSPKKSVPPPPPRNSAAPKKSVPPAAKKSAPPPPAKKSSPPPPPPKKSAPAADKSVPPPPPKKSVPPPPPKKSAPTADKSVPPPPPKKSVPPPKKSAPILKTGLADASASPAAPALSAPVAPQLTTPNPDSSPSASNPPPSNAVENVAGDPPADAAPDSVQRRLVESVRPTTGMYPPAVVETTVAVQIPETISRRNLLIGGGCAFFAMSCCGLGTCVSSYLGEDDDESQKIAPPPKTERVAPQVEEIIEQEPEEPAAIPRLSDVEEEEQKPAVEPEPPVMKKRRRRRRRRRRKRRR